MGLFDGSGALGALDALLDREKALILKGDILGVQALFSEKERLLSRVGRARFQRTRIEALMKKAERNNALLEASARGFKAVQDKLIALRGTGGELSTYDREGQRARLGSRSTDFSKRA
ncbi:MAG: hypothetical protein VX874_22245 [Pseudomonadota bacterium]|nr:hypothetical protein [Pseudomonadota bacterium]